ncbi:hypothetical protein LBMAG53_09880 [Planctomycetota bacterium]|nr:hypothetical protein LBMAG53_09880 [Planctomycetota bacterium]
MARLTAAFAVCWLGLVPGSGLAGEVIEGDLHQDTALNIGTGHIDDFRSAAGPRVPVWVTICLDLDGGEALRQACVAGLRAADPRPAALVTGFRVAAADIPRPDEPWLIGIGRTVPLAVIQTVLAAVRTQHHGPLVLRDGNDESGIISVSPCGERFRGQPPVAGMVLDQLLAMSDADQAHALIAAVNQAFDQGSTPSEPPALLVDLTCGADGASGSGAAGLQVEGGTWTADGLYLPARAVVRPKLNPDPILPPSPPYRVSLSLPALGKRRLTVTLLVCLASAGRGQDNLFCIGRRSRWFSAQVGPGGVPEIGLDNRWYLMPASECAVIDARKWHALTVGCDVRSGVVRVMVDDGPGQDLRRKDSNEHRIPPRQLDGPDELELQFCDPGTTRHLHGMVRRIIVHSGLLNEPTIAALHRALAPTSLPAPTHPQFADPVPPPPPEKRPPKPAKPATPVAVKPASAPPAVPPTPPTVPPAPPQSKPAPPQSKPASPEIAPVPGANDF